MTPLRICLAAVLVLALCSGSAVAQDTTRVPGPTLLKRIAEAVDGDRTGQLLYVVARYDSLSPVRGVLQDRGEATTLARRLGAAYDVFGPFRSPSGPLPVPDGVLPCPHDGIMSILFPSMCPYPVRGGRFTQRDIAGIEVSFRLRDGTTRTFPLSRNADAVFFTMPAIEKFAIPYYLKIVGAEAAATLQSQFAARYAAP